MPKAIVKKLKEMNEPNYAKDRVDERTRFNEFRKKFRQPQIDPNERVEVVIKLSSLESETQKKLLSLMRSIFDIGNAASEIYEGGKDALIKTYFSAILDPTDMVETLSRFQTVLYSAKELPVPDNLFWPGGGTMLCETHYTPTGTTISCLHHDMHVISDVWGELWTRTQNSLSTWKDEIIDVEKDDAQSSPDYWPGQAAYRKKINALISKIDHLNSCMPQIASHMTAFAEEQQEWRIERQKYEDNNYDESEDFLYP